MAVVAGRSTRSLDVMRGVVSVNERTKGWLYTALFWSGIATGCIGAALFGAAGTFAEYLAAIGVILGGTVIWWFARMLNSEDVDRLFRRSSPGPSRGASTKGDAHDI